MAVPSNSTAMSARNMDRRVLLRGAAALVSAAALPAMPALARSRTDIAKRVHALAAEISHLLSDLDEGMWELRVSPPFRGMPMFSVEPGAVSPEARLNRSLTIALAALNEIRPGLWRKEICLKPGHAFAVLINDSPAFQGAEGVA